VYVDHAPAGRKGRRGAFAATLARGRAMSRE
jgi:hypothetical protein